MYVNKKDIGKHLRIQVRRKGLNLQSYCEDDIETINPTLGEGPGFLGI